MGKFTAHRPVGCGAVGNLDGDGFYLFNIQVARGGRGSDTCQRAGAGSSKTQPGYARKARAEEMTSCIDGVHSVSFRRTVPVT